MEKNIAANLEAMVNTDFDAIVFFFGHVTVIQLLLGCTPYFYYIFVLGFDQVADTFSFKLNNGASNNFLTWHMWGQKDSCVQMTLSPCKKYVFVLEKFW